ncbi:MAG: aminopeptidase [Pseudomonadota bacterium]
MEKELNKELKNKLFLKKKCVWDGITPAEHKKIYNFCDGYKDFLNSCKTEREAVAYMGKASAKYGYKNIEKASRGDKKLFINNRGVSAALVNINNTDFEKGFKIIAAHVDSPQLDLKSITLYEAEDIAYMKTKYYGGIKKYQWVTIPLAMHGVVVKADGKTVNVVIGESNDEPVFTVNDLLVHLAQEQVVKPANKVIEGEQLNIIVGSIPYKFKTEKDSVKLAIMDFLNKKYGIVESDLISAELHLMPAGIARDVGFDKSLIGAHGQDDRACAYTSLEAFLDIEKSDKNLMVIFFDKEEIGSYGLSSADSTFLTSALTKIMALYGVKDAEVLNKALMNSKAISADVSAAIDPEWKSVMDIMNSAKLGYGVSIVKCGGTRGKYNANDTGAEFMSEIMSAFNKDKVRWQIGELGKVDQGGGGTISVYFAYYGMDVVDCGLALLSMHSPFEISSKADVYSAYLAYKAFYKYC